MSHFEDVLDALQGRPGIQITFDDGNASDYELALPALQKRGLTAAFFICSGRLGLPTFVSVPQVRELLAAGMAVGSHGVNHKPWRNLGAKELHEEIAGSRSALEDAAGVTISEAACPFGSYDWRVIRSLRAAGYRVAYTSDGGIATSSQWLRARTTVKRTFTTDDIDALANYQPTLVQRFSQRLRTTLKSLRPPPRRKSSEAESTLPT